MHGLVNKTVLTVANGMYNACKGLLDLHLWLVAFYECQLITLFVLGPAEAHIGHSINTYDICQPCRVPPLCYNFSNITKFLSRSDVKADLGIGSHSWEQCNQLVELALVNDWVHEFKDAVSTVLSNGRRVMVYSRKEDYICNASSSI